MELLNESATSSCFSAARRKRSDSRRRPRLDPKPLILYQKAFTSPISPMDDGRHGYINSYSPKVVEPEHPGNERKFKKLKLKLGGVTRTLHTKSSTKITSGSNIGDAGGAYQNQPQASLMDYNSTYDLVQKSKRAAKKHDFDDEFNEDDDEEIRYLKKLKSSKVGSGGKQEESDQKTKGIAKLIGVKHSGTRDHRKDLKKRSSLNEDNDYEMQMPSDDELKGTRAAVDFGDIRAASGQEMTMTTRKRALECPESGGLVEFPNGLPEAPSKKQQLSEVQHQLRKTEIAQRRRLQADRAAKEAEAEAIRKILGQDSSRKKKEDKLKKKQEELAQERNDMATILRPNTIRLSMSPNGTVLTFSEDLGLPKMFNSMPCRYPPPREKCVGPNCTNEYKYRDSKSKLPLCSLHCYKAVQGNAGLMPAC
ncbi:hypothetical protein RND81_14G092100 [Saponaria officinalis]|uniref:INO80 complex subunit B-like conserved region domain-containing protein n=1 Tax=Saponaria officinalis TaxID=3572 RepID=A0AAW1GVU2_SAPOF